MAHGMLGKKPANRKMLSRFMRFRDIVDMNTAFPAVPDRFGHYENLPETSLGMLGNDQAGCCVYSGAAHHVMYWSAAAGGTPVAFSTHNVLADYSSDTGWIRWLPTTDQGTDMAAFPNTFMNRGVHDAAGKPHKIDSFAIIEPGDWDALMVAMYTCEGAGLGFDLPQSAEDQFDAGEPWTLGGGKMIGGHYVTGLARNSHGNVVAITWGKYQAITRAFYERYSDEVNVYISLEMLNKQGLSADHFDLEKIRHWASLFKPAS